MTRIGTHLRRNLLLLLLSFLASPTLLLAEVPLRYQGTHILTYETMERLARAFADETGITMQVRGGGCADGIAMVVNERFEMGGLCCPPKAGELAKHGLLAHPVARDIKVVIVNQENPLNDLAFETVKKIHQGKIDNWRQLGWIAKPIALIFRSHCADRQEPVRTRLAIESGLKNLAPKAIRVSTDKEVVDYIHSFRLATGITSNVFAKGQRVKVLTIDGVAPTAANIESGRYPFAAPLFIITRVKPDQATSRFLDFVRGPRGQAIVRQNLAGMP